MIKLKKIIGFIGLPDFGALAKDEENVMKAKSIIQAFYAITLFLSVLRMIWWQTESWISPQNFHPLWGLFWVGNLQFGVIELSVKYIFLVAGFVGAAWYKFRWGRIVAFLGTWQVVTYIGSFNQQFHHYQWFPWLFASFLFVFLPSGSNAPKKTLLIVWGVLAFYLLTYTNIFISRVIGVVLQISRGEVNAFTPQGYLLQLAEYTLQQPFVTDMARFFLANPVYGWIAFMFGMYVYAFSLWAMFRPSLIRTWGFLLFLISTASYINTTAFYIHHFLFLTLFFFEPPFLTRKLPLREVVSDVPILGWALRLIPGFLPRRKEK